jgi:hypothetical protein
MYVCMQRIHKAVNSGNGMKIATHCYLFIRKRAFLMGFICEKCFIQLQNVFNSGAKIFFNSNSHKYSPRIREEWCLFIYVGEIILLVFIFITMESIHLAFCCLQIRQHVCNRIYLWSDLNFQLFVHILGTGIRSWSICMLEL